MRPALRPFWLFPMNNSANWRYQFIWPTALILIVTGAYWYVNDATYYWFHDGGVYLQISRNITAGEALNHAIPWMFPPGQGILLWIWSQLTSSDISDLKLLNLISLALMSGGAFLVTRSILPFGVALLIAADCLINPEIASWRGVITSDFTFAALVVWTGWLWQLAFTASTSKNFLKLTSFAILLTGCAILTRYVGVALSAAAITALIIALYRARHDKTRAAAISIALIATLIMSGIAYNYVISLNEGFSGSATTNLKQIWQQSGTQGLWNFIADRLSVEIYNISGITVGEAVYGGILRGFLTSVYFLSAFCIALVCGFIIAFRSIAFFNLFLMFYLPLIIFVPWTGQFRYYFPILFLFLLYLWLACDFLVRCLWRRNRPNKKAIGAALIAFLIGGHLSRLPTVIDAPKPEQGFFDYMTWAREEAEPDAIICEFLGVQFVYFAQRPACHMGIEFVNYSNQNNLGVADILHETSARYFVFPLTKHWDKPYRRLIDDFSVSPLVEVERSAPSFIIFSVKRDP